LVSFQLAIVQIVGACFVVRINPELQVTTRLIHGMGGGQRFMKKDTLGTFIR
jgi:hypothetical protein